MSLQNSLYAVNIITYTFYVLGGGRGGYSVVKNSNRYCIWTFSPREHQKENLKALYTNCNSDRTRR
jgi:hypothetical protein